MFSPHFRRGLVGLVRLRRFFVSLAHFVKEKLMPCKVPGCTNTWVLPKEELLKLATGKTAKEPRRMCDACFERYREFTDREISCSAPGCGNSVTVSAYQQLVDERRGRKRGSRDEYLCEECQKKAASLAAIEVPCRVKGCPNTWKLTGRQQVFLKEGQPPPKRFCDACARKMAEAQAETFPCRASGCQNTWTLTPFQRVELKGHKIPQRFCESCHEKMKDLQPVEAPCRVRGCGKTWTWTPAMQVESGESGPPKRMCSECFQRYQVLNDRDVRCRVKGCPHTWVFTRLSQMEHKGQKDPRRMCPACNERYMATEDKQVPCKIKGCGNTWTWSREAQFRSGGTEPPARMCDACAEKLEDRQVPCSIAGCTHVWVWKKADQMGLVRTSLEVAPPQGYCERCRTWLDTRPARNLTCAKCGAEFLWDSYGQLMHEVADWPEPVECPSCAAPPAGSEPGS